jgi:hypothetical protein
VRRAESLFAELITAQGEPLLLHGESILSASRETGEGNGLRGVLAGIAP